MAVSYIATFIDWLTEKIDKNSVQLADNKTRAKWKVIISKPANVLVSDFFGKDRKLNAVMTVNRMKGTKGGRRTGQVAKELHIKYRLDIFSIDTELAKGKDIRDQLITAIGTAFNANPYTYAPLRRNRIDDGPWDDDRIVSGKMLYNSTMVILYLVSVV